MKNLKDKIETTANLSIIVVAVLLSVVLIKSYLIPATVLPPERQLAAAPAETLRVLQRGDPVSLPEVDWQKNGSTLLLALSPTCRFCTNSAAFYQRIVRERGNTKLIALMPQDLNEGQSYLRSLGVAVDEVRQTSLSELKVTATPTLILVNGDGKVEDVWVGTLSPGKETEVLNRVGLERAGL